jgi:hypothetical protein
MDRSCCRNVESLTCPSLTLPHYQFSLALKSDIRGDGWSVSLPHVSSAPGFTVQNVRFVCIAMPYQKSRRSSEHREVRDASSSSVTGGISVFKVSCCIDSSSRATIRRIAIRERQVQRFSDDSRAFSMLPIHCPQTHQGLHWLSIRASSDPTVSMHARRRARHASSVSERPRCIHDSESKVWATSLPSLRTTSSPRTGSTMAG